MLQPGRQPLIVTGKARRALYGRNIKYCAFGFIAPKTLIIWLSNLSILSVPDKRVFQMYIFKLFLILK
jgi:hypothetical protein